MMDRHPTDFGELLFGFLFLATGAGFIVHQISDRTFDPAWMAAIALVAIGGVFLAATLLHLPRRAVANEPPEVESATAENATVDIAVDEDR